MTKPFNSSFGLLYQCIINSDSKTLYCQCYLDLVAMYMYLEIYALVMYILLAQCRSIVFI